MDNKKLDRETLKSYFKSGAIPTESNFSDLIDGILNQSDDHIIKRPGEPLSIAADGDSMSLKILINFYQNLADLQPTLQPTWMLNLNPRSKANDPTTAKAGFGISDGQGTSRLFIDAATGKLGVGTTSPQAGLEVNGADHQFAITNQNDAKTKIDWAFTNYTDDKLYVQCWRGNKFLHNVLTIDQNMGLTIDQRDTNNTAITLNSSGYGWGSGLRFNNTNSGGGKNWGIYSAPDGQLHFADIAANSDVIQVASRKVVVYGTLVIETSQGEWRFQDDGNFCFANKNGTNSWDLNQYSEPFRTARSA